MVPSSNKRPAVTSRRGNGTKKRRSDETDSGSRFKFSYDSDPLLSRDVEKCVELWRKMGGCDAFLPSTEELCASQYMKLLAQNYVRAAQSFFLVFLEFSDSLAKKKEEKEHLQNRIESLELAQTNLKGKLKDA